jgi:hypothetical protein
MRAPEISEAWERRRLACNQRRQPRRIFFFLDQLTCRLFS